MLYYRICGVQMAMEEELCLVDSCTTDTILRETRYFQTLRKSDENITTITGSGMHIVGTGRATIILPNGTELVIQEALLYPESTRTLLSFKDIRANDLHVETNDDNGKECLIMTKKIGDNKKIVETFPSMRQALYYTYIKPIHKHVTMQTIIRKNESYRIWHDRLGHPGLSMMKRITNNSNGHSLKKNDFPNHEDFVCIACAKGKLITRPSKLKVRDESPAFLNRIQGDICGPISPLSGPFRYFMVLIDASTKWSHVCLLSTRNHAFARLISQIIQLRANFPDSRIQSIRMDNAGEFTSKVFNDYCMALGIKVEHSVPHVHTQNGLAESLIKRIKFIARPLIQNCQLPSTCWGHAVLHAAALIQLRPSAYHEVSPIQLVRKIEPNISHLRKFGCAVYIPIPPPQRTTMGPQRKLGIYVGFESPSIIKYLEPLTGDLHTARFADSIFNEDHFPALGGGKYLARDECREITWESTGILGMDPRTKETEHEVQSIIDLQRLANELPEAFTNNKGIMKSHIPAVNAPERIEIPHEVDEMEFQVKSTLTPHTPKRGRQSRNTNNGASTQTIASGRRPKKLKTGQNENNNKSEGTHVVTPSENVHTENTHVGRPEIPDLNIIIDQDECERILENSTNYVETEEIYDRKTTNVDIYFAEKIAKIDLDPEPKSLIECKKRSDWPKWKEAIAAELFSLNKRKVFGPVDRIPEGIFPVGHKWVFVRKRNENNQVVRYKARLVAQGFTQRPGIDFDETYSPVMDGITFLYLISMAASMNLQMKLMDVVTAYLYGSLDANIYMKVPEGITVPNPTKRNMYCVKLQRSLYGLKQSGRMWYNRLSDFLEEKGFLKNDDCPCVFIQKSNKGFCIISVYVDDLNVIGTTEDIEEASSYLKSEFEMKDLGKTTFCLGLQLEHNQEGILVHQSAYTKKVLEKFHHENAHPEHTPMMGRSLDIEKDPFRPREDGEELLGSGYPYLSAIGALMYLANGTRPDIAFAVNLLARFSSAPTKRHWNGIKRILRYLRGTIDLGLYFQKKQDLNIIGYTDAGYLSDPHNALSQTGYVFLSGGTAISWKSAKQTMVATSTNHSEIIALYEAAKECTWLRRIHQHVQNACGIMIAPTPTIIYEDNSACIAQVQSGYIKSNITKHISPKFFYTHNLQKNGEIKVTRVKSCDNLADVFTKVVAPPIFEKCVRGLGMRRLREIQESGGELLE